MLENYRFDILIGQPTNPTKQNNSSKREKNGWSVINGGYIVAVAAAAATATTAMALAAVAVYILFSLLQKNTI